MAASEDPFALMELCGKRAGAELSREEAVQVPAFFAFRILHLQSLPDIVPRADCTVWWQAAATARLALQACH